MTQIIVNLSEMYIRAERELTFYPNQAALWQAIDRHLDSGARFGRVLA